MKKLLMRTTSKVQPEKRRRCFPLGSAAKKLFKLQKKVRGLTSLRFLIPS
jgi:hypothetical protein